MILSHADRLDEGRLVAFIGGSGVCDVEGDVMVQEVVEQPRAVRVVAWLTLILGAWGVLDELNPASDPGIRWLGLLLSIAGVVAGLLLVRRRRSGYLATVAWWSAGVAWALWFFLVQGEYTLAARLWGLPVIAVGGLPLAFLLSARARRWARQTS